MNSVKRVLVAVGFVLIASCLMCQLRAGVPTAPPVFICAPALEIDGHLHCGHDGVQVLAQECGPEWPVQSGNAVHTAPDCLDIGRMRGAALEALGIPVDVNHASLLELESLPGIGPVLARRIADARPFDRVDDLRRVSGIGRVRMLALRRRAYVAVDVAAEAADRVAAVADRVADQAWPGP